ncbi:MAG: DUF262 domain-containing protein [Prevotella sp.]|nr:DUF262 domain-containing protein [Prevotella sp.]
MEIEYSTRDAVNKAFPNKIIHEHLYWIPRSHRYFQLSTPIIDDPYLHHEVIRRSSGVFIELHFEGEGYSVKYQGLIDYLIKATADLPSFVWEYWGGGYRCQYASVMENERQLIETLAFFMSKIDELIENYGNNNQTNVNYKLETDFQLPPQGESVEMHELSLDSVLRLPLSIPDYQRIYCWEEENVRSCLDDIFSHTEKTADYSYRLGTIILHHISGRYDIIDGQQRLITLSLLLNELGVTVKLLNENVISSQSYSYIAYNKHLIQTYCQKHPRDYKKLSEAILNYIDFSVLVLENASIDLAYTFFSNQNSRGVPLTDYDLLKAHHLRFIPLVFEQQSMRAAETWNFMIESGRVKINENRTPDYIRTLEIYLYHLRKWMRKKDVEDGENTHRIKKEYESSPVIDEIPPFGERFYFNEPIQGGVHFFSFVEQHLQHFKHFSELEEYKFFHNMLGYGSHKWYRDAVEALLFGYYLKFGEFCLSDALVVIIRIILQHRYENGRAHKSSIIQYARDSEIIMMIDQATSPTFFLAEARNIAKNLTLPMMQEMSPIRRDMLAIARRVNRELSNRIIINSFKTINL